MLGMLCCGVNQCAANLPSYLEKGRDFSGTFRTFAMYFGLLMAAFVHVGILRLRGHRAEPIRPGELRSLAVWAGSVGLVSFFVGKYLTFPGLDRLERLGAGSMGYPVMVAACIVGFFLYGFFVLRERISARQAIGAVLGIAGILFGCLDSAGGEVALPGGVTTSAPGWTFTEDERPSFAVAAPEQQAGKSKLPQSWRLLDWRGREVRHGEWPADGRLTLAPLPPGYYRVEPEGFDFCVVRRDPCRHARDSRGGGVQIDLLIQTERSAYLVEIKRQNRIGREIEDEVETKMRRLPVRRGVSIHPVLVHLGEVSGEVDGDGFFDAIIPAESLLQSC